MFIDFTPRDILPIILLSSACFAFFYFLWPFLVTLAIKKVDGGGEGWNKWAVSSVLVWILIFWKALIITGGTTRSWIDSEPGITAIGLTLAIFFSYGSFLSPSFHTSFLKVVDFKTGDVDKDHKLSIINIPMGRWYPIFLAVYNTNIKAWNNYRITIDIPKDFEISLTANEYPQSAEWSYTPNKDYEIGQNPAYVQKSSTKMVAMGGTSATRFFIKANIGGKKHRLKIMATTDGRLFERKSYLEINVKENIENQ